MQPTAIPPTLIELAQQGNRDAFDQVARASGDRCMAIACRILRDVDLAEDAVQTTLVQAWRELRSLRDVSRFEPWLQKILVRACYAESKRQRRWSAAIRTLPVELPSGRNDILTVDNRDQLERAFRRLSVEHRSVLVLHRHVGLPLPDVAERLGINLGTAKSRLHYATSALRASLEADARTESTPRERSA